MGADLKLWDNGLKGKMSTYMADCVTKDPPGGTWEDRCIRSFGKSDNPDAGKVCMSGCVRKKVDLSKPCADCWGGLAQCTYDKCAMNCLLPDDPKGKECTTQFCSKAFEACSGIKF